MRDTIVRTHINTYKHSNYVGEFYLGLKQKFNQKIVISKNRRKLSGNEAYLQIGSMYGRFSICTCVNLRLGSQWIGFRQVTSDVLVNLSVFQFLYNSLCQKVTWKYHLFSSNTHLFGGPYDMRLLLGLS